MSSVGCLDKGIFVPECLNGMIHAWEAENEHLYMAQSQQFPMRWLHVGSAQPNKHTKKTFRGFSSICPIYIGGKPASLAGFCF